jgi:hypothetical protein
VNATIKTGASGMAGGRQVTKAPFLAEFRRATELGMRVILRTGNLETLATGLVDDASLDRRLGASARACSRLASRLRDVLEPDRNRAQQRLRRNWRFLQRPDALR